MPDQGRVVVTNTTPLIALAAATGNLDVLRTLYTRVVVPYEVAEEIRAGGKDAFGLDVFDQASWLEINPGPVVLPPYLQNTLDRGEASVIQTALQQGIKLVCIDETVGRRIARLSNLSVTGTIGILLKAKSMIWLIGNKGAKLIHISTDYVFDGTKTGAYVETDPPNPTYTPDLAAAILEIVRLNSDVYGIYHFANEGKISWHDFACEIYRLAQEKKFLAKEALIQRIVTEDYPTKTQRPQNSYLSKGKITLSTFVNLLIPFIGVRVYYLHGKGDLPDKIMHKIRGQLKLSEKYFKDLVACPLTYEGYLDILKRKGLL